MLLSNFRTRLSKFARNCPISVAIDQFRTLSSDSSLIFCFFWRFFWTSFIDLISDIIVRFQTSLSEFEHSCAILNTIFRFWTLLSVFVHHRATFDATSSDFGHCIPISSIIALFRHFCPILDIMF